MNKSAHMVKCPPQLGKLTPIRITIWQGSLEVNTSTDLVLTCSVLFHADRFHWNDHNPCIFVLKGTKLKIKKFSPSAIVFVRASVKYSLVWPSGWLEVMICSYRGIHLLRWQLKWTRDSWFHFDILKKKFKVILWAWPSGRGERHTPCRSGLSLCSWNILFLWEKIKRKKTIKNCDNWRLLQGDDTQLTTILARSKFITLLPSNPCW